MNNHKIVKKENLFGWCFRMLILFGAVIMGIFVGLASLYHQHPPVPHNYKVKNKPQADLNKLIL